VEQIQGEGGSVVGFGRIRKRSVLGCGMSRNGIRSLVIALAIGGVIWAGLAIKILHFTGVFNG
jgi:hypothetical protein